MLIRYKLPLRGRHQSSMYPASGDALEEQPFFMVAQTQTLHHNSHTVFTFYHYIKNGYDRRHSVKLRK